MSMRTTVRMMLMGLLAVGLMGIAAPAFAQSKNKDCNIGEGENKLTCTCLADLEPKIEGGDVYILSNISLFIQETMVTASERLFYALIRSDAYQNTLMACATLMLIFYAVGFTIGVVQANFIQVFKRLIMLGLVFSCVTPYGWYFFSDYVVKFFNTGTDNIIGGVMEISTGIPYYDGDSPFLPLDGMARYVISSDMLIAVLGAITSGGPYSLAMGAMLGAVVLGLIKMLLSALRVYAVAYILRALLLGAAPIFIIFILFEKTKPLFMSWVNALVNLSLQPILYFTFLSFFVVLMSTGARDMMNGYELCWTEYKNVNGTDVKASGWRFAKPGEKFVDVDERDWQGAMSCKLAKGGACNEYPLNIIEMLSFLLLIYVATKFVDVVDNIAHDISNSYIDVGGGGAAGSMFGATNKSPYSVKTERTLSNSGRAEKN